ncbi:MAG: hypothetical protein LBH24_03055 [Clostridiales bacterium]|jgi:MFS family permease|nr:hypothetical protein [Clostridiales bacterium]
MEEPQKERLRGKKLFFRILGFVLLAAAVGCIIGGFVSFIGFMSDFMGDGETARPNLFWLFFIGFPLIPVSAIVLTMSRTRPSVSRTAQAAVRVRPPFARYETTCPGCSAPNPEDNAFCSHCGKDLHKDTAI